MSPLPNDWLALMAVVYALGLKHGMDLDHLATIDGIARSNAARNPRLARSSGFLFSAGHGAIVILVAVGALFALSFDTVSQVALFSLTARSMSGWGFSIVIGIAFMLGMMITDGVNGLWVARLLARADRRALIASRAMGLAIAGLSLLVGSYGLARRFVPAIASHTAERELLFGCAAVAIISLSFLIGLRLAPAPVPVRPPQT